MSLKSDVIVKNQYTIKNSSGKGGSRGGSPGKYVLNYMARDLATETVAPVRREAMDDFILRYMARDDATESMSTKGALKKSFAKYDGLSGRSFGYGSISLSHEETKLAAKDIQEKFDQGKTVFKTVVSFDQDYLVKHGLVDSDFTVKNRGDYRGHVDQSKLRLAVMHGLDRMSNGFEDFRYIGVIQVDTEHVHAHLAMVDAGAGRVTKDGTQKGKLSDRDMMLLRRGIDASLDEFQVVAQMSSSVDHERRNVVSYVKKWASEKMIDEDSTQLLVACLPEDRRLWRYGSHAKEMRRPNELARQMVREVMDEPDSGIHEAMNSVREYAVERQQREQLDADAVQQLINRGQDRIMERCVNSVYRTLREMPQEEFQVRTPMLEQMSMDYDELIRERSRKSKSGEQQGAESQEDDLVEFSYRLRSYSSRMSGHHEKRAEFHEEVRSWERTDAVGAASKDSAALYRFYLEEEEYHAKVSAKYRHFLNFQTTVNWQDQWQEIEDGQAHIHRVQMMSEDPDIAATKDEELAEKMALERYGVTGGSDVAAGRTERIDRRLARLAEGQRVAIEDFQVQLAGSGLVLETEMGDDGVVVPRVQRSPEYDFSQVRSLDMHDMGYDFDQDITVDAEARQQFIDMADRRIQALAEAEEYLRESGQGEEIMRLGGAEIRRMDLLAQRFREDRNATLPSKLQAVREEERVARIPTVRLDDQISRRLLPSMEAAAIAAEGRYVEDTGLE